MHLGDCEFRNFGILACEMLSAYWKFFPGTMNLEFVEIQYDKISLFVITLDEKSRSIDHFSEAMKILLL